MKTVLRIEEAFLFLLAVFLFSRLEFAWWWFPLLLFVPDIGMIGYAANPRIGAYVYNAVHHRALAVALYLLGALLSYPIVQLIGIAHERVAGQRLCPVALGGRRHDWHAGCHPGGAGL